jgi:hypothetical protein
MANRALMGCAGLAVALSVGVVAPASAQGLFEAIFGAISGRQSSPSAYADPNAEGRSDASRRPAGQVFGGGTFYCVRLCDGRFFPIQRHANTTPAQLCSAMCPATQTRIFSGSEINRSVAPDGSRYADLDNAFTYRERVVENCSCNGKDAFGLARMNVSSDPTLRSGDIVATTNGLMTYNAATRARRAADAQGANFTPVDPSQASRDVREKLANTGAAKQ